MKSIIVLLGISFFFFGSMGVAMGEPPLPVVSNVDLNRYLGKWHEIARYPAWFQKGCVRAFPQIPMDSQPYAHHGRGGLSGNFRTFAAKRLRSSRASQNGSDELLAHFVGFL